MIFYLTRYVIDKVREDYNANKAQNIPVATELSFYKENNSVGKIILNYLILIVLSL